MNDRAQLALELASAIRPQITKLSVMFNRTAPSSSLTAPQLTILAYLADEGECRISDIAKAEGIRMPTASNALHQLQDRGLVERVRDEADRRGVKVRLTEKGESEFARVSAERCAALAAVFETLTDEELAEARALAPLIQKLAERYSASA